MKVLGIIPARFGSSRFLGKPLIDLKGKTMIQRVYEGVQKSDLFSDIIVATDDDRIVQEVKRFGGKVMLTSNLHTSGTDRCGEVIDHFSDIDIVVNIQGDEPLVDYRQLNILISTFEDREVDIASLGIKDVTIEDIQNPNRIKIVVDYKNNALYFSRSAIPNYTNSKGNPLEHYPFYRHIGLYAFRTHILKELVQLKTTNLETIESLEQLRWMYYGYSIRIVETDIETPNIDVPEDVEKVLRFL